MMYVSHIPYLPLGHIPGLSILERKENSKTINEPPGINSNKNIHPLLGNRKKMTTTSQDPITKEIPNGKYEFDWYDDHSSWRLEELGEKFSQAQALLTKYEFPNFNTKDFQEINQAAKNLRSIYRQENSKSQDVKASLLLADEIEISEDTQSFDSQIEYESMIEQIKDTVQEWSSHFTWIYNQDEWDISPIRYFENLLNGRNGLSERWDLEVNDNSILFPDGQLIHGYEPTKEAADLFMHITYDSYGDEKYGEVADQIAKLPQEYLATFVDLTAPFGEYTSISDEVAYTKMLTSLTAQPVESLKTLVPVVMVLSQEWHSSAEDLVPAALALMNENPQPVHA
jgi:hypothetical protein